MGTPMKGLKIKQVKLSFTFKKDVTVKKTVKLFVNDIREAVTMMKQEDQEFLEEARLEVLDVLAIIENKQAKGKGMDLVKVEKYYAMPKM